jgi:hypothetical protein
MDNVMHERTYAQPLSGLQVSWGAVLSGALTTVAVASLLWALTLAVVLSATHASVNSVRASAIALAACAVVTTLIGAFFGGAIAGYLPGNPRRAVGALHAFLAWALAFVVASGTAIAAVGALARTATDAAVSTAGAAARAAGGVAGGELSPHDKAVNVLTSLGYSASDAEEMVRSSQDQLQSLLRGGTARPHEQVAGTVRGALDTLISWQGAIAWVWFLAWAIAAVLAVWGGVSTVRRGARSWERTPEPTVPYTPKPRPA